MSKRKEKKAAKLELMQVDKEMKELLKLFYMLDMLREKCDDETINNLKVDIDYYKERYNSLKDYMTSLNEYIIALNAL